MPSEDKGGQSEKVVFTSSVCYLQFFIAGTYYGLSPLILPVSARFFESGDDYAGGIFFYGFAELSLIQNLVAMYACFVNVFKPLAQKRIFVCCSLCLWPIGIIALAVAVQYKQLPILFGFAFPCMGVAIGVQLNYLHFVEMALWWDKDIHKGHAMSGGMSALGATVWTLSFGEVLHALGHDQVVPALWIFCGVQVAAAFIGLLCLNPARYLHDTSQSDVHNTGMSLTELLRNWRVLVFLYVMQCFYFVGISMKTLISVLFEEIFDMDYVSAVRYSAACLSLYVVARVVAPFLSAGNRVFSVFMIVLLLESIAYASTPWAVRIPRLGQVLYTIFRLIGGAGFAVLLACTTVLLVRVFGAANVPRITGLIVGFEWICGLGPSIAFLLHVDNMRKGGERQNSWNVFFYLCAALTGSAAVCVLVLRLATRPSLSTSNDTSCQG